MKNIVRVGAAVLLLAAGAAFIMLAGRSGTTRPDAAAIPRASVAATPAPDAATSRAEALLARAGAAYSAGRIVSPVGDNAVELFLAARQAMQDNTVADEALSDLQPALATAARAALNQGDNDEARRIAALLEQAAPGSLQAREIRNELQGLMATLPTTRTESGTGSHRAAPQRGGAVGHAASAL